MEEGGEGLQGRAIMEKNCFSNEEGAGVKDPLLYTPMIV